jgi:hypothetical protein
MRIYSPSPEVNADPTIPMFTVTTNDMVCSVDAYTLKVPSKENRYIAAITITMTDEECDFLVEALAEARGKRLMAQEKAYEALSVKFGGAWDNSPAGEPERTDPESIPAPGHPQSVIYVRPDDSDE